MAKKAKKAKKAKSLLDQIEELRNDPDAQHDLVVEIIDRSKLPREAVVFVGAFVGKLLGAKKIDE